MSSNNVSIYVVLLALMVFPGIMTAQAAVISLDKPLTDISPGQTFDVGVIIDPQGASIAGAQLDIEYNKSDFRLNSITEGDLFSQGGASTIFNSGLIDNSLGSAVNIYGAILGSTNVKTQGTFIIINATAIGSTNDTNISLVNILVVGPKGDHVYPTPTNPGQGSNGVVSGNGGSASGGGGSGGASGENYTNIESTEKYDRSINKDVTTSYWFRKLTNPIVFVNITGNTNSAEITTSVEVLKGTSTLVNTPPPELVFKNINIWVGTFGYATPKNIKNAQVIFKVPIEWMEANNIDPDSIEMMRYDNGWQSLPTRKLGGNNNDILYEANTIGFSEFSITGKIAAGQVDFQEYRDRQPALDIEAMQHETNKTMPPEPENPGGFNTYLLIPAFFGIMTSSILGYKIRKLMKK
jgi:PGF-pre-PGF domain-containing protein